MNREILESLDLVGHSKAVGYLPLRTITDFIKTPLKELKESYRRKNLNIRVFSERDTCIKSGAFFVYDKIMMEHAISAFQTTITNLNWSPVPIYIIGRIARNWYDADHPVMPFVRALYGDL